MCSASPPAAPDYAGAAKQQGQSDIQTAIANAVMNRPQENTPLGSRSWEQSGTFTVPGVGNLPAVNVPQYTSNVSLTPQGQRIYDTGLNTQENLLKQAGQSLSQPMDSTSVKDLTDQAYGTITSRLDPQWSQARTSEETKLVNQGLRPGAEAYDNAMRDFNYGQNDAYSQAGLAALGYSPQLLQEQLALRNQPLNELNALQTGAQISMPQFGGTQPVNLQGPNYQTALGQQSQYLQGLYNADQANANSMNTGMASIGSAALMAAFISDRRLKSNIVRVGTHPLGIGIYEYDLFGQRERGVMADEVLTVKPEAVIRRADGYMMVNYGAL